MEEGEGDFAGVVMRENPVGRRPVAARRRLMAVDAQVERHDRALGRKRDARPVAAVYDRVREHEKQVADAGRTIAEIGRHDLCDHPGDLRPDPFERGNGSK